MAEECAVTAGGLKNEADILCQHCSSKILKKNSCTLIEVEKYVSNCPSEFIVCDSKSNLFGIDVAHSADLPHMRGKSEDGVDLKDKTELIGKFWLVVDMFTFENVGFTNTVDEKIKYLICADCEIGPIGYQELSNVKHLYVAQSRVKYSES